MYVCFILYICLGVYIYIYICTPTQSYILKAKQIRWFIYIPSRKTLYIVDTLKHFVS